MGRARDLANILSSSGSVALDSEMGLSLITPTSIANTGGSASISSNGTVSFTSASAVSLNGTFSSTYTNYKLMISGTASGTTGDDLNLRLRASGSDNSTNNYNNYRYIRAASAANSFNLQTIAKIGFHGELAWSARVDLFNPQTTDRTIIISESPHFSSGNSASSWNETIFNGTTQFDGFTIFPEAGNFTGTIAVYGYRK